MKLTEYIKHLQKIAETNPNVEVVYASDSEGNNFDRVYFTPSLGKFEDGVFSDLEIEEKEINAVCIN
jgi:hypothetical protein